MDSKATLAEQAALTDHARQQRTQRDHDANPLPEPRTWLDPRRDDVRVKLAADQLSRRTGLLPSQAMVYVIPILQALSDEGHLAGPALTSPEEW